MTNFRQSVFFAIAFMCLCGTTVSSNEFIASVNLSPYEVRVGDPVTVTYTVTAINANSIQLDPLPETISDAAIINTMDEISENLTGAKAFIRTLTLVPFTVEDLSIPRLGVQVIDESGKSVIGSTPGAVVHVRSVAPGIDGPEEMKSLKGIDIPPEEFNWTITVIIGSLILIIIASVIWFFIRKRTPSSLQELLNLTPAQRALKDLKGLLHSQLLVTGKHKEFFTKLADITRRYLGLRYHILALEMTSKELCHQLAKSWQHSDEKNRSLGSLLHGCDLVKFAKFIPPEDQGKEGILTAEKIVQSTRDDNIHESVENENGREGTN